MGKHCRHCTWKVPPSSLWTLSTANGSIEQDSISIMMMIAHSGTQELNIRIRANTHTLTYRNIHPFSWSTIISLELPLGCCGLSMTLIVCKYVHIYLCIYLCMYRGMKWSKVELAYIHMYIQYFCYQAECRSTTDCCIHQRQPMPLNLRMWSHANTHTHIGTWMHLVSLCVVQMHANVKLCEFFIFICMQMEVILY